jgi:ketosteroid isomerase-like protein
MRFSNRLPFALLMALAAAVPAVAHAQIEEGRVPLRTALDELNTLRATYADVYNRKDAAGLAALYDPEAIILFSDGTMASGHAAIKAAFLQQAPKFPHVVIASDSIRVYGNTAVDQGTLTYHPTSGPTRVERYLVVLRRGMMDWKIVRGAAVPLTK